jgi:hypothetical protein
MPMYAFGAARQSSSDSTISSSTSMIVTTREKAHAGLDQPEERVSSAGCA